MAKSKKKWGQDHHKTALAGEWTTIFAYFLTKTTSKVVLECRCYHLNWWWSNVV